MDHEIDFTYEGKKYTVSSEAYDLNLIILPDGRAIKAKGWWESLPPQPDGLHEVHHLFSALEPAQIAKKIHGVLAVEIKVCQVRTDWLTSHATNYPQWSSVIDQLIANNSFVVIPAQYGWKEGSDEDQDLMVLERGVKGPPATFRINPIHQNEIECVNYPGSYKPMVISRWIEYVNKVMSQTDPEDEWIQGILSQ